MGEKVILLDFFASMFGMRARIALAAKGVAYEYREQDLRSKSQLLLQSNPIHKQIPVLIHNDKPVCESRIILEYIDEVWNQKYPLLPPHPYQRAQARFWADYVDKKLYGAGRKIWSTGSGEEVEAAKKEMVETLKQLESELGKEAFFGGERLGFLDVALVPYSTWFHTYEMLAGFSIQEHCPKLTQWVKRCLEIDFVSESLADPAKVYDLMVEQSKEIKDHFKNCDGGRGGEPSSKQKPYNGIGHRSPKCNGKRKVVTISSSSHPESFEEMTVETRQANDARIT